jgi:hypothetical protein
MARNALGLNEDFLSDSVDSLTKGRKQEKEPRVQVAEITPSTTSDAGGQAPAAISPYMAKAQAQGEKATIEAAEAEYKKQQSEGKAAAEKQRQAAIYEQYKPELTKRFEPFEAPKETFSSLAGLGMMLMAIGSMGGKKGLTSATGAMNAIAGMATGYQQGRKEEFDRQKAVFDENLRIMKENQAQIQKEFEYALKYAQKDVGGATTKLATTLKSLGLDAPASALANGKGTIQSVANDTLGPMAKGLNEVTKKKLEIDQKIREADARIEEQKSGAKATSKNYLVNGKVELLTEPEAMSRKAAGADVQLAGSTSMRLGAPLTDESQEKLAQAVANYSLDPKTLSVKDRAAVLERAIALNPEFQQGDFGNRNLAQRNWVQPNGAGAKQIAAFTTVAQHLDTLQQLADAQVKTDTPKINSMINYFQTNLGYPEVTNFDTAKQAVAAEVVKAITGTAGALADRQEAERALSAAASPEQVKGAVDTLKKLIGGRIETSRALYTAGTGRSADEFNKLLPEGVRSSFSSYAPSLKKSDQTTDKKPKQNLGKPDQKVLDEANAAINKGAPKASVMQELKNLGYDMTGYE